MMAKNIQAGCAAQSAKGDRTGAVLISTLPSSSLSALFRKVHKKKNQQQQTCTSAHLMLFI